MSEAWISWKPRIEEPSKPRPSSIASASKAAAGKEVCCQTPGRSVKRRSMISTPWSLTAFMTSAADVHPSIMG